MPLKQKKRKKKEEAAPGPEKKTVFLFKELSEEAKEKAIEQARESGQFTFDDPDFLTDLFVRDLEDHYQLGTMKVYWSLGYCQGDGVCFDGKVDVDRFLVAENMEKKFGTLIGRVSARIHKRGRSCHSNSMDVEVEVVVPGWEEFLSEEARDRRDKWERLVYERRREQQGAREYRDAPIHQWERAVEAWRSGRRAAVRLPAKQDWTPREPKGPGPRPAPLDIPIPPDLDEPEELVVDRLDAEKAMAELDRKANQFEEWLRERVASISSEMENTGYSEIEYHTSDENLTERLLDEFWTYEEDGTRIGD